MARTITSSRTVTSSRAVGTIGNLIYNGGFEIAPSFTAATSTTNRWINGTAAGSTILSQYGWFANPLTNGMTAYFDNAQAHSGTYSFHIAPNGNSNASCQIIQYSSLVTPQVGYFPPTTPSTAYTYSVWVKTTVNSGSATGGFDVQFLERTVAGASNGGGITTTNILTTQSWTQYTGTWTLQAGTVYVTPKLSYLNTGGAASLNMDVWVDDLSLVPATGRIPATGRTNT